MTIFPEAGGSTASSEGNGNDVLDGGPGGDMMAGGAGNDHYISDNANDRIAEAGNGGIHTLFTAASRSHVR